MGSVSILMYSSSISKCMILVHHQLSRKAFTSVYTSGKTFNKPTKRLINVNEPLVTAAIFVSLRPDPTHAPFNGQSEISHYRDVAVFVGQSELGNTCHVQTVIKSEYPDFLVSTGL